MRRTVWAVTSGSYSDYSVMAIFETREDADEVAKRHGDDVEEMTFYTAGDHSYRTTVSWVSTIKVRADGTFKGEPRTERLTHSIRDDDGLLHEPVEVQRWTRNPDSDFVIRVESLAEDKAIKGVKDRAAEVSAMIVEGVDPREIERGEPSESDIQTAWAYALIEAEKHTAAAQRQREAEAKLAEYKRKREAENMARVALFDGDTQVSVWTNFAAGHATIPTNFEGDTATLELREPNGNRAVEHLVVAQLAGSTAHAMIWPTTGGTWNWPNPDPV